MYSIQQYTENLCVRGSENVDVMLNDLDIVCNREFGDATIKHLVGYSEEWKKIEGIIYNIRNDCCDDVVFPVEGTRMNIVNKVKLEYMDEDGMIILYSSCHTENDTGYTLSYYTMGSTRYW